MNKLTSLLCILACLLVMSCKKKGGGEPVDASLVEVTFSIEVEIDLGGFDPVVTYAPVVVEGHDIRYIVDVYREPASGSELGDRIARIVATDSQIDGGKVTLEKTVKIPAEKYRLLAWVDFVNKGSDADLYYDTKDLKSVKIIRGEKYAGYSTERDAFAATMTMDLTPFIGQKYAKAPIAATVERPFGVYRIVTTDVAKYIENNPGSSYDQIRPAYTNVAYQSLMPTGYNVQHGVPGEFKPEIGYRFATVGTVEQSEAILASDMVFVNGEDSAYDLGFEVYTPGGDRISSVNGLRVNLKRNKMTVIRDTYLTQSLDGGIGIDPGFDDEIIVPIN